MAEPQASSSFLRNRRIVIFGVLIAIAASAGALALQPTLPAEYVDRPRVFDCGQEVEQDNFPYSWANPQGRACLFDAYVQGRPAEFRNFGMTGTRKVFIVTGIERADEWADWTKFHGAGHDLVHRVGCTLERVDQIVKNYVFHIRIDPATHRLDCQTQFTYIDGHGPPHEEPPECTLTNFGDHCPVRASPSASG